MSARDELVALQRAFDKAGSTTTLTAYALRRVELLNAAEDEQRAAGPRPAPAKKAAKPGAKAAPRVARDAESTPVTIKMMRALTTEMSTTVAARLRSMTARIARIEEALASRPNMPDIGVSLPEAQALLARLQTLESRPSMIYAGVWRQREYARGEVVTQSGSLWCAKEQTNSRPGVDSTWQLCVKKGRDAR